jgi:2-aminoethylphosphonate-pyruvate transaminase
MKNKIKNDFLLLESDLLYEIDAINQLINDDKQDIILASGKTNSNDEVYIEANNSNLTRMSKKKEELNSIYGELVGISKISLKRYKMMCDIFENQDNQKIDYEYIMVATSKKLDFYVKRIEDLIWCEIDDDSHLQKALKEILPKIIL